MSALESNWTSDFFNQCQEAEITIEAFVHPSAYLWHIKPQQWQAVAELALTQNLRWVSGWAEHHPPRFFVNACFEKHGIYLLLRSFLADNKAVLPTQATVYPAASRSERHTQDMFGVEFSGHPDPRR
jgi:NADH:ubiquinone oxidoreductase subunit C